MSERAPTLQKMISQDLGFKLKLMFKIFGKCKANYILIRYKSL